MRTRTLAVTAGMLLLSFLSGCATIGVPLSGVTAIGPTGYLPMPSQGAQLVSETESEFKYTFFYGTTRRPLNLGEAASDGPYSAKRDTVLHYGTIEMLVPKHHQVGSTGSDPSTSTGGDPRLVIHDNDIHPYTDESAFLKDALLHLRVSTEPDSFVVYIHGYRNTFKESAIRAGQLGVDLGIPSYHLFLFNWPSAGTLVHGYFMDEATIDASEPYLAEYLRTIAEIAGTRKIHVIAHSMGNRALLRVVASALNDVTSSHAVHLGQVILAAPDVDVQVFSELAPAYVRLADHTTVYMSPYDKAVHTSEALHAYPRVGCGSAPLSPVEHIDYVVSNIDVDLIDTGHDYFASAVPFLANTKSLIYYGQSSHVGDWQWHPKEHYWSVEHRDPSLLVDQWGCQKTQTGQDDGINVGAQ